MIDWASALAALPDPLFILEAARGPDGTVVELVYAFLNEAAARLYGKSVAEVVGHGQCELFPTVKELGIWDTYMGVIESGSPTSFEVPYFNENGVEGSFRLTATKCGDGLLVSATDTTAQVKAEKALEADSATLRSTLDSLMDPHVLYNAVRDETGRLVDLVFVYANPAACAYFDLDFPDLIGKRLLDLFPGHVEAGLFEQYARVVEMGEPLMLDDFLYRQELLQAERRYDIRAARVGDGLSVSWRDVTDRHEAAEYASRMAAVVEQTHDAIIGTSFPDTLVTSWNRAAERMYGYTAEEVIGKTAFILTPKDHLEQAKGLMPQLSAGEPVVDFETVRIRKDGTEVQVSMSSSPICDADGVTVGLSTIHRDITKEKQAREYANRMAAVVEYSGDAIIGRGLDDAITSWNPAAERILGYSSQEIIGTSAGVLIPKDRAGEVKAIGVMVRAGKSVEHLETTRVRKDGTVIPVSITVSPIRDVDGAIVGASTIARDRSEQVRAETALAETSRQYRLLAENASDVVAFSRPDGVIEWVSPAVTSVLGWAPQDLLGTRLADLIHPDDQHSAIEGRARAFSGRESNAPPGGFVVRMRVKSGQYRWMSGDAKPVKDESGVLLGVVSGVRNVDDLVQAREVAQALSRALETSNESLRDFVAVASHDLRSPLVTIAGFTKILTDNWATLSDEARLKELGAIGRGVERLSRLTNDLLSSAKIEAEAEQARPEQVRLATVLTSYLEAGRELGAVAVTCPAELVVVVDPSHLTRILDNYLTNAFKYGEPPICIEAERVGDFVELRVRDHGPGVPSESVSRLFTKFDRGATPTARATQGTGLGLSIVKALAEANHGEVGYQQNEPTGGCFVVRLPAGDA
jgi:PAS domain S-box-containing protein